MKLILYCYLFNYSKRRNQKQLQNRFMFQSLGLNKFEFTIDYEVNEIRLKSKINFWVYVIKISLTYLSEKFEKLYSI